MKDILRRPLANERGNITVILLAVILIAVLGMVIFFSRTGWGYAGYHGYSSGSYFGGPKIYGSSSVRSGSLGGPSHLGGGLSGGK